MSATKIILIAAQAENQLATLSSAIEKHCINTSILAIAHSIAEGEEQIKTLNPHLVILEINNSANSGLELLDKFETLPFQLIIVNSNKEFNPEVMKFHPTNYLLLPISPFNLQFAITDAKKLRKEQNIGDRLDKIEEKLGRSRTLTRIGFVNNGDTEYHSVKEVMYIEADDNYCRFYLNDDSVKLVTHTLKYYEEQLSKNTFIKIHRSFIVNKEYIKCIHQGSSMKMELQNGKILEVSRDHKNDLKEEMERN